MVTLESSTTSRLRSDSAGFELSLRRTDGTSTEDSVPHDHTYDHTDEKRGRYEQRKRDKLERLREEDEMKFSHSIQFNAVPDWANHYIAYSNLKKL